MFSEIANTRDHGRQQTLRVTKLRFRYRKPSQQKPDKLQLKVVIKAHIQAYGYIYIYIHMAASD